MDTYARAWPAQWGAGYPGPGGLGSRHGSYDRGTCRRGYMLAIQLSRCMRAPRSQHTPPSSEAPTISKHMPPHYRRDGDSATTGGGSRLRSEQPGLDATAEQGTRAVCVLLLSRGGAAGQEEGGGGGPCCEQWHLQHGRHRERVQAPRLRLPVLGDLQWLQWLLRLRTARGCVQDAGTAPRQRQPGWSTPPTTHRVLPPLRETSPLLAVQWS